MEQKVTKALTTKEAVNQYMVKNKIEDFTVLPFHEKLNLMQNTPAMFIKERKIGKTSVPYIEHSFAEKALNLAFNFNVSNEVVESGFREYEEAYYDYQTKEKKARKVTEAECMVKFTFKNNGVDIVRTVYSSHKGFANPATTRGDVMKSAISKSWTVVARTFGIGADLKDKEEKAINEIEQREDKQETVKPTKSFAPKF